MSLFKSTVIINKSFLLQIEEILLKIFSCCLLVKLPSVLPKNNIQLLPSYSFLVNLSSFKKSNSKVLIIKCEKDFWMKL